MDDASSSLCYARKDRKMWIGTFKSIKKRSLTNHSFGPIAVEVGDSFPYPNPNSLWVTDRNILEIPHNFVLDRLSEQQQGF